MTEFDCNGDWLLEYADGELSAADSARAELHLATCASCSREVAALKSSREMLSAYFATADAHVRLPSQVVRKVSWNAAVLALASTAATALLVSLFFFLERERGEVVRTVPPPAEVSAPPVAEQPAEDDVLALISRETQIARLRMASEILAKEPGMNERHLAIEKYLTQAYGVTTNRKPFEM